MNSINQYRCKEDPCATILPGEVDVCVGPSDCKVRADVTLNRVRSVSIWGIVTDSRGWPVPGAMVKLLRHSGEGERCFTEVCRTRTDPRGEYRFDLSGDSAGRYRVLVSPCVEDRSAFPAGGGEEDRGPREEVCCADPREPRSANYIQYY